MYETQGYNYRNTRSLFTENPLQSKKYDTTIETQGLFTENPLQSKKYDTTIETLGACLQKIVYRKSRKSAKQEV